MDRTFRYAVVLLSAGLLAGCHSHRDPLDFGSRQEGDLETRSRAYLYSPRISFVPGDTMEGLPRDRWTGGGYDSGLFAPPKRPRYAEEELELREVAPPAPVVPAPPTTLPGSGGTGEHGPYAE